MTMSDELNVDQRAWRNGFIRERERERERERKRSSDANEFRIKKDFFLPKINSLICWCTVIDKGLLTKKNLTNPSSEKKRERGRERVRKRERGRGREGVNERE